MNKIYNIDKLHIQFKYEYENQLDFSISNLTDNFQILINTDKIKYSSKSYNQFNNIYYENKFIGILLSNQKQNKKTIQIHFNKEILYSDFRLLLRFYDDFVSLFGFDFDNFSRLEISLNELDSFRWTEIFKIQSNLFDSYQCNQRLYQSNSKAKIVIHSLYNNKEFIIMNKSNSPENQKRISNSIAIYLKTNLEDYQIDFYRNNGLDVENRLYRTEARLYRSFFYNLKRRNKGFDFKDIFDLKNQIGLFEYAIGDKLDFKNLTQTFYDKNRNRKHPLIKLYEPISEGYKLPDVIYPIRSNRDDSSCNPTTIKAFRYLIEENLIRPSTAKENAIIELIDSGRLDYQFEIQKFLNKGVCPNSFDFLKGNSLSKINLIN